VIRLCRDPDGAEQCARCHLLRAVAQNGLRAWITANVARDELRSSFSATMAWCCPANTHCLGTIAAGIERGLAADRAAGAPFTERHVKNWEEEIELARQDLLGGACDEGWEYYSYYTTPFDKYAGLVDMSTMHYVMVEERFDSPPDFPLKEYLAEGFDLVAETTGAGGEGYGLKYRIFERRKGQVQ
jgi:hypothetical protein